MHIFNLTHTFFFLSKGYARLNGYEKLDVEQHVWVTSTKNNLPILHTVLLNSPVDMCLAALP